MWLQNLLLQLSQKLFSEAIPSRYNYLSLKDLSNKMKVGSIHVLLTSFVILVILHVNCKQYVCGLVYNRRVYNSSWGATLFFYFCCFRNTSRSKV